MLKFTEFSLEDLNYYLYSCSNEEREKWGNDCYDIPDCGKLPFAGFSGVKKIL